MEGRARGAPFCKKIFVLFLVRGEREREERRERERARLCCSPSSTHCKEAFHDNTNRAVFPACCCSCVYEFMNECLYVLMICCRCMLDVHLQG
jgi:hypothetical protein